MNNDLNNMTKRYKDEMMKMYGRSCGSRSSGQNGMNNTCGTCTDQQIKPSQKQNGCCSASRDVYGTPVNGTDGAAHYTAAPNVPAVPQNGSETLRMDCECRFPAAESIINGTAANTPMTLPAVNEEGGAVYSGNSTRRAGIGADIITPTSSAQIGVQSISPRIADLSSGNTVTADGVYIYASPSDVSMVIPDNGGTAETEIYPGFELPPDLPADSDDIPSVASYFIPSAGWISLTGDNSWGFLQFEAFVSGTSIPVQGAAVTVKRKLPSGTGLVRVIYTDTNGKTPIIALPAPANIFSLFPQSGLRPFAEYEVSVSAWGYYTLANINVPVYAGVKSVQPVALIPLPQYQTPIQPRNGSVG